ncbi:MAG TPA: dephospho-CoA kinase [Acidimicrobiales bacterium]|nr:dephospho-CoA kinase [Acidimicrobiales bacterium]
MLLIALTGGIGAGKSSASALLVEKGAVLVDADAVARDLQKAGGKAFGPMVELFGEGVVGADGELNRAAIAAIVFPDKEKLAALNALMLPMIGAEIAARIEAERASDNVVLLDLPLLGMGTTNNYGTQAMIVVDCPVEIALDRVVNGPRAMKREDAEARIAAQITREERLKLADFVIDNSGSPADLALAVDECWKWILSLA